MDTARIAGQASQGHTPVFRDEHIAPGWAACVNCGRAISIGQLVAEVCPGAQPEAI